MRQFHKTPAISVLIVGLISVSLIAEAQKKKNSEPNAKSVVAAATPPNYEDSIRKYEKDIEKVRKDSVKASRSNAEAYKNLQPVLNRLEGEINNLNSQISSLRNSVNTLSAELNPNLEINKIFLADLAEQRKAELAARQPEIDSLLALPFSKYDMNIAELRSYRAELPSNDKFGRRIDLYLDDWQKISDIRKLLNLEYNATAAKQAKAFLGDEQNRKRWNETQWQEILELGRTFYAYPLIGESFHTLAQDIAVKKNACSQATDQTMIGQYRKDIKELLDNYRKTKYFPYIGNIPYMKNLWDTYTKTAEDPRKVYNSEKEVMELLTKFKPS